MFKKLGLAEPGKSLEDLIGQQATRATFDSEKSENASLREFMFFLEEIL